MAIVNRVHSWQTTRAISAQRRILIADARWTRNLWLSHARSFGSPMAAGEARKWHRQMLALITTARSTVN